MLLRFFFFRGGEVLDTASRPVLSIGIVLVDRPAPTLDITLDAANLCAKTVGTRPNVTP